MVEAPSSLSSLQGIYQHTLRRQLKAEITELTDVISTFRSHDAMQGALENWAREFRAALDFSLDEALILRRFAEALCLLLHDSLRGASLESSSFLGSDGQVYGEKALMVYLHVLAEPYQGRSPFTPQDERLFFVIPHLSVNAAVAWLKTRGFSLSIHPEIEQQFLALEQVGQLPQIPTEQVARCQERMRKIRLQQRIDADTQERQGQVFIGRLEGLFQRIQIQIEETNTRIQSAIEAESLRDQEALQVLTASHREWQERIQLLEVRNETLSSQLKQLETITCQIEQETKQLEHAINETYIAIAQREKKRVASLLQTVAIIGVCAIVRFCIPQSNAMPLPDGNGWTVGLSASI